MKCKSASLLCLCICLLLLSCPVFLLPAGAETENLASGMSYTIATGVPTTHSYDRYTEGGTKFDVDRGQLTDGIKSESGVSDPAWYHAFRSQSRLVTFDFKTTVSVSGFSAGFYHGEGYYAPRYVRMYLSENGNDWFMAGQTAPSFALSEPAQRYQAKLNFKTPYAARFVRIEFCVDIFACCDEIEIFGQKECTGKEQTFEPDAQPEKGYCTEMNGDPYGITDIVKIYNGYYPAGQDSVRNDADDLLPYVAYLDQDGKILDTMFDAVAFVPCVQSNFAYPSGGTLVRVSKYPTAVMSDWIFYTDFLFEKGYELDALNTAVGSVNKALGRNEKFPVLLTMPYPGATSKDFGDINGDGKAEPCFTAKERIAVVKWYNAYLTERFAQAGFENLDFIGYYWYEEEVNYTWSAQEKDFTTGAVKALKDAGKTVLFDPFYLSTGFDHWQELGFDGAVMQPNVAFTDARDYFELEMLEEFAETIHTYHLGVEIETNEPGFFKGDALQEAAKNYERYLYMGWKTGYMSSIHTFYQGAAPGTLYTFCHSDSKQLRRLYDITYAFIKETYTNEPPAILLPENATAVPGEKTLLDVQIVDADSYGGDICAEITECAHGRAQFAPGHKSLIYLPDADFEGTEHLVITVDDGHNPPQTVELDVTVAKEAEESPAPVSTPVSEPEGSDPSEPESSFPLLAILLIAIGALAVIAIVIFVLLAKAKKKKS